MCVCVCVCVCVYLYSKDMHPQTIDFIRSHVYFISKCLGQYLQVYNIYVKIGIWDAYFQGCLYSLDTGSERLSPTKQEGETRSTLVSSPAHTQG